MPAAISAPPASSSASSVSESSTTAIAAARNGWRFAASVARDGPIRSSERNQSTFVRTSGPSVANTSSAQTSQPRSQSWLGELRQPRERDRDPRAAEDDGADPRRRVAAHQRCHEDRVAGPRRGREDARGGRRRGRPRAAPPEPERDERDAGERAAAPRPRSATGATRCRTASPASAAKIGVAPRISPSTDADVRVERVDEADLVQHRRTPPRQRRARGRARRMRSDRSSTSVERDEDEDREAVADGRVGERLEAVREDVAADREVERPEPDRREQHHLDGRGAAHRARR